MRVPACRRVLRPVLALLVVVVGLSPPAFAQAISYEYDDLGRLILVASPEGVARYEYDAVGNLLRIVSHRASETTDPVAIFLLAPDRGPVGTEVHLYGKGFGETPSANQVAFNGTPAPVTTASTSRLVVSVPPGATTGPVTVTAPGGSATSLDPFTVTQQLAVVPAEATAVLGRSLRFQATRDGTPIATVRWQVEGTEGGTAPFGTITPDGLYTAPASPPPREPLTIQAVDDGPPTETATARVSLVPSAAGSTTGTRLSVWPPGPPALAAPLTSMVLSVAPTPPSLSAAPFTSTALSVAPAAPALAAAPVATPGLSVSALPVVTGVSPAGGARGTSVPVTLTGVGLAGATALTVLKDGSADATITVTDLVADPGGTQATATLTLGGSAPVGARILRLSVGSATSTALGTGRNSFTVY